MKIDIEPAIAFLMSSELSTTFKDYAIKVRRTRFGLKITWNKNGRDSK